jgi:hypothetical protein
LTGVATAGAGVSTGGGVTGVGASTGGAATGVGSGSATMGCGGANGGSSAKAGIGAGIGFTSGAMTGVMTGAASATGTAPLTCNTAHAVSALPEPRSVPCRAQSAPHIASHSRKRKQARRRGTAYRERKVGAGACCWLVCVENDTHAGVRETLGDPKSCVGQLNLAELLRSGVIQGRVADVRTRRQLNFVRPCRGDTASTAFDLLPGPCNMATLWSVHHYGQAATGHAHHSILAEFFLQLTSLQSGGMWRDLLHTANHSTRHVLSRAHMQIVFRSPTRS